MKTGEPGDMLYWNGRLYKIIGIIDMKAFCLQSLDENKCPHCGGDIGKDNFDVIESSPLFQETAMPIKTIKS